KSNGAQHPQVVFGKTFARLANRSNYLCAQIGFAFHPVQELVLDGVKKQSVHGEVTSKRVGHGVPKNDLLRPTAISIVSLGSEGGHLKLAAAFEHNDDSELSPHRDCPFECCFDLVGKRRGDDVVIFRLASQQEIPYATAHPECSETACLQLFDHGCGSLSR